VAEPVIPGDPNYKPVVQGKKPYSSGFDKLRAFIAEHDMKY
jgi:hypothetical protein